MTPELESAKKILMGNGFSCAEISETRLNLLDLQGDSRELIHRQQEPLTKGLPTSSYNYTLIYTNKLQSRFSPGYSFDDIRELYACLDIIDHAMTLDLAVFVKILKINKIEYSIIGGSGRLVRFCMNGVSYACIDNQVYSTISDTKLVLVELGEQGIGVINRIKFNSLADFCSFLGLES